jgi:hypothetical protein
MARREEAEALIRKCGWHPDLKVGPGPTYTVILRDSTGAEVVATIDYDEEAMAWEEALMTAHALRP